MKAAEELRTAAKALRETARLAHGGPWRPDADELGRGWDIRGGRAGGDWLAFGASHDNAAWIALMSPALAEPLAKWLEESARQADRNMYRPPRHHYDPAEALAVARVINGGAS